MRIYIAGPMTGLPEFNYPAFHAAAAKLEAAGYDVANPASEPVSDPPQSWEWYLRRALKMMLDCDAVALLPGWENSRGAVIECRLAIHLGMRARLVSEWLDGEVAA